MADINQTTSVTIQVNGKQAEETIKALTNHAKELDKAIKEASNVGDSEKVKKLNKELNSTNAALKNIQSTAKNVDDIMGRLDQASPKELRDTLKVLNKQLSNMERGTVVWKEQTEKIKQVKDAIKMMNAELEHTEEKQKTLKERFSDVKGSILADTAALAGVYAAGKEAVEAYANMDQEMANVRKFTGMTAEEVAHMNEEFKKIDTRTSRDNLNKLAQEAGRLGKTSEEDVLGFVKAADKINVALDDLGEGATLTLSKLTNIFGDEARYGTEQSLLKVGSVINELSQNCTASAPYLAQFAQRLAGVGAQAGMTIPQIMAFGAVLDSQGQAVEMSASALSKLIMNLFKNADKICQATGMNVKQFKETAVRDTNEALIMLLERLHEMGNMDALAPLFQEMGENGVRSSQVLAALAGNIETVKAQQEAANVAFEEGISIDKEFNVQNTTVQAGLEKARKGFQEMAVTLGKELIPIVSHLISGTSAGMRVMLKTIEFIKDHRTAILASAAAVAGYTIVVELATIKTKLHSAAVAIATLAQKAWNAALKANPIGLVIGAVAALTVAIVGLTKRQKEQVKIVERQTELDKKLIDIDNQAKDNYVKQAGQIRALTNVLYDNNRSLEDRRKALKELKEIVPGYNAELTNEGRLINDNKNALDNYLASLKESIRLRANEGKLQTIAQEQVAIEDKMNDSSIVKQKQSYEAYNDAISNLKRQIDNASEEQKKSLKAQLRNLIEQQNKVSAQYIYYVHQLESLEKKSSKILAGSPSLVTSGGTGSKSFSTGGNDSGGTTSAKERFKAEEEWRAMEEAKARIAYARGESNYTEYTERMQQISVDFYKKELDHTDLSEKERLEITANYEEALKKQRETAANGTIEQENERYNQLKAVLVQQYADGQLSTSAYNKSLELAELEHLQKMIDMYEEGSKERLKAQERYNQASLKYQEKHASDAKKFEQSLKKNKWNTTDNSNSAKYAEDQVALKAMYDELQAKATTNAEKLKLEKNYYDALYVLAHQYGDYTTMYSLKTAKAITDDIVSFLNSDGGKAITESFSTIVSGMSQIFSGITDIIEAEVSIQTAEIESRYDKEIEKAGENETLVAELEQKKQDEIAAVKSEASKKEYAMQVTQAIAQTAISAINAYSSAAAIPVVGYIMAPIAAAMAVAAGTIQIAALKKQQEAAAATGYAGGGYTTPGPKYQPAGIVHAGEWVATQETLANPTAAAAIATIDQAQRTNSLGSLSRQDVSRSVSGSAYTAQNTSGSQAVAAAQVATNAQTVATLAKLNQRLNEPFVTVNTASGDKGIKKAINLYDRMNRGGK